MIKVDLLEQAVTFLLKQGFWVERNMNKTEPGEYIVIGWVVINRDFRKTFSNDAELIEFAKRKGMNE